MLREGPLHAAVKELLAAPGDRFEVPVDRFVIDLVRADGELVEVQTGNFGALGKKLDVLLDEHRVRVVHPVAAERRIVRVDEHERKADRAKNIRVEDSRRRRVARGLPPDRQPGEGPQAQDGDDDDRDGFDPTEA